MEKIKTKKIKKQLKKMLQETTNELEIYVINYLLEKEDPLIFLDDLYSHGCVSGMVSSLIYYSDTIQFFQDYKDEINSLLSNDMQEDVNMFNFNNFDKEDPLCLEQNNQNLLAWYGFERTADNIRFELEEHFQVNFF